MIHGAASGVPQNDSKSLLTEQKYVYRQHHKMKIRENKWRGKVYNKFYLIESEICSGTRWCMGLFFKTLHLLETESYFSHGFVNWLSSEECWVVGCRDSATMQPITLWNGVRATCCLQLWQERAMSEIMLIYPSKTTRWSGVKEHLSRRDSVCIDIVLLSMRAIAAVCTTIISRFVPGHQGSAVQTTVISWSKKHLWPQSFRSRWLKGNVMEAPQKST